MGVINSVAWGSSVHCYDLAFLFFSNLHLVFVSDLLLDDIKLALKHKLGRAILIDGLIHVVFNKVDESF